MAEHMTDRVVGKTNRHLRKKRRPLVGSLTSLASALKFRQIFLSSENEALNCVQHMGFGSGRQGRKATAVPVRSFFFTRGEL